MKHPKLQLISRPLTSLFLFLVVTTCISAQDTKPVPASQRKVIVTTEYFIKPNMLGEYLNFIRTEARPLYLKAGAKRTEVFTRVFGQTGSMIVMEYFDSYTDMTTSRAEFAKNGGEALQLFNLRSQRFIEANAKTLILRSLPEGTWINPKKTYQPTRYYAVTHRWIAPFRMNDYINYLQNDYLPLLSKSDEMGMIGSYCNWGDEMQVFISTPLASLADLDTPSTMSKVISNADLSKLQQQKLTGVVTRTEQFILRFWEDLSISTKQSQEAKK